MGRQHIQFLLKILVFLFLLSLYLVLSIKDLKFDVINPDGINWHTRTTDFTSALYQRDYPKTFRAYHPGTTLMWISGPVLDIFTDTSVDENVDPKSVFLDKDYKAKLSIVLFCSLLVAIVFMYLWNISGFAFASFFTVLLTLEPFVIGMRRLYHLDYLMTLLLFCSYILSIYFGCKKSHIYYVIFAGFFYALSLLTKTTAILFLPAVPFIFFLGNDSVKVKARGFLIFIMSTVVFLYIFFPPIWRNPIIEVPHYIKELSFGVTEIGVSGKKEMGTSGKSENVVLDDTFDTKNANFYIASLFMRMTTVSGILIIVSIGVYIYILFRGAFSILWNWLKTRSIQRKFTFHPDVWLSFWSLGLSLAFLVALTISNKKTDRYEILILPFLFLIIAGFLSRIKFHFSIPVVLVYVYLVFLELLPIHPHYLAYTNPNLGGVRARLHTLDNSPFGIGSYAAFDVVKRDRQSIGYDGYYTIAGSKSIKAISEGGRFSRNPSCVTDYVIVYALEEKPVATCVQKYMLLETVKIGGFDYWYVYKRLNQKHQSNYE